MAKKSVFNERADLLAKPLTEVKLDSGNALLVFCLGEEKYALQTNDVIRVIPVKKVTPLPFLPAIFAGLLYESGLLWPVLQTDYFFQKKYQAMMHIVMMNYEEKKLALLVGDIVGKESYEDSSITSHLLTAQAESQIVIDGIYHNDIAVINTKKLFHLLHSIALHEFKGE